MNNPTDDNNNDIRRWGRGKVL